MARRRLQRKVDNDRPVVTDDFIYNEPETPADPGSAEISSDTPEEAIRKLRRRNAPSDTVKPDTSDGENEESWKPCCPVTQKRHPILQPT